MKWNKNTLQHRTTFSFSMKKPEININKPSKRLQSGSWKGRKTKLSIIEMRWYPHPYETQNSNTDLSNLKRQITKYVKKDDDMQIQKYTSNSFPHIWHEIEKKRTYD